MTATTPGPAPRRWSGVASGLTGLTGRRRRVDARSGRSTTVRKRSDGQVAGALGTATVLLVVGLSLIGTVMVLSASSVAAYGASGSSFSLFLVQLRWLFFGVVALFLTARFDYRRLERLVPVLVLGALALLVLVLVPGIGISVNGARRWLGAGPFRFQPDEIAKFAVVVHVAALASRQRHRIDDWRVVLAPVGVVLGAYAFLLYRQPKFGSIAILAAIAAGILLWAGARIRWVAGIGAVGVVGGLLLVSQSSYQWARITAFLDPEGTAEAEGYQTMQSLIGVASGGVTGTGLGASRAKWGFLPEAHTDFVFAIVGEELGLVGSVFVLGLLAALIFCGVRIASRATDPFGSLLAIGITTWIAAQAFVNVGAVLGILPITGVPLPFVSFGGSSLVTTMAAVGVLVNVALHGAPADDSVRDRIAARRAANRRAPRARRVT